MYAKLKLQYSVSLVKNGKAKYPFYTRIATVSVPAEVSEDGSITLDVSKYFPPLVEALVKTLGNKQ